MLTTDRIALVSYTKSGRRHFGSGLRIGRHFVLTADHCVDGTGLVVRCDGADFPAQIHARTRDPAVDIAILQLTGDKPVEPMGCARVNRSLALRVEGCQALGFPRWKMSAERIAAQVDGYIPTAEGLSFGTPAASSRTLLTLKATGPEIARYPIPQGSLEHSSSPWAGMSGAVVVTMGLVLGVIRSHNLAEGGGSLTVTPIDAIDLLAAELGERLWTALGVTKPQNLPVLPAALAAPVRNRPRHRPRLLIVEDQVGPAIKHLLAGYDCELVTSIEMWWQLVEDGDLEFDGALVDLHLTTSMKDEYGGEVLRFLRDLTPPIPALLMSVSPTGWGPELQERYGAIGVFYKDRDNRFRDIRRAVDDLLNAGGIRGQRLAVAVPGSAHRQDPI